MKKIALKVAGTFFLLLALVHVLRLVFMVEIVANGRIIPLWMSAAGALVCFLLSLWMFDATK